MWSNVRINGTVYDIRYMDHKSTMAKIVTNTSHVVIYFVTNINFAEISGQNRLFDVLYKL